MKIAFTGGGTAGHAVINTVLIPYLQKKECSVIYIGSYKGMEKNMVKTLDSVDYFGISTGKLRRYVSFENLTDMFKVFKGFLQAYNILKTERPHVLYSGGGYVSVPVVLAAKLLGIPILIRETDYSVGLANRLCLPFAQIIFTSFPDTRSFLKKKTSAYPGMLIRPALYDQGDPSIVSRKGGKPLCLILGGSSGAKKINEIIWKNIDYLSEEFIIVHVCGRGKLNKDIAESFSYRQLEFLDDTMGDYLNAADVVVTRCGSNAILETLALGKKTVCIPITSKSSRGEQKQNAQFAVTHGNAVLLEEVSLTGISLNYAIKKALNLNHGTAFQITKKQLISNLETHTAKIWEVGCEKLQRDFFRSVSGKAEININDLSQWELQLYDEIACEWE